MKVKYKVNSTIYNALVDIFYETKEVEDVYDMARIITTDNEVIYRTCCGNEWLVGFDNGTYYFGYRGTRNGFIRAQPFYDSRYHVPRFFLDYPSDPYPVWRSEMELWICIRKDYVSDVSDDNDADIRKISYEETRVSYSREEGKYVEYNYVCYELKKLIEYETTLPRDVVHPLDRIETTLVDDKVAVIMRGRDLVYPLMVIEYKNMYKEKK